MVKQIASTFTITIKKQADSYTIEASGSKGIRVAPQPSLQLKTLLSDEQIKATLSILATITGKKSRTKLLEDIKKLSPEIIEKLSDEDLSDDEFNQLIDRAISDAIQKLGHTLYNALLIPPILLAFGKVQGSAKADTGVRLRLRIEPPELAALPWETLYDGQDWLSTQSTTPLVRQLILEPGSKTLQKLQVRGALRIIFVGASPEDLEPLNIEEIAQNLEELLEESLKKKRRVFHKLLNPSPKKEIVFHKLLNATLDKLREELVKDYHILYFAGHGSREGIFLDDGYGDRYLVSAETLARALEGKPTRLVFLAACKTSAAPYESGLLAGFAQDLAKHSNLPAIVAMQYSLSDMSANDLTSQFFAALAAECPVDVALADARKALIRQGRVGRDVFSPVLYLQAENGALFPKAKDWLVPALGALAIAISFAGWLGLQIASTSEINRMTTSSEELFASNNQLEALLESIRAGKYTNNRFWINADTRLRVAMMLQNMMYKVNEYNRLEGQGVWDISFSPKDDLIALAGEDNTVKLWQPDGTIRTLKGHNWSVTSVSFSPDGHLLASASKDNTVKLWKRDGSLVRTLEGYSSWVNDVAFSPDGQLITSASEDGTVKLSQIDGTLVRTLKGHNWSVTSVSFSPNGQLIASASWDKTVKIWKLNGTLVRTLKGHSNAVEDVSFSPDGQLIASASRDNTVKIWKLDGSLVSNIEGGHRALSFSPDGQLIASAGADGTVKIWKLDGTLVRTLKGHRHDSSVTAVSFSSNGEVIATASANPNQINHTVRLWKLKSQLKTLAGHTNWVNSVSFSPDGKLIASASDDRTVKLWKSDDRTLVHTLQGHHDSIWSVSFSPDGKLIASASLDNTVKLWKLDGTLVRTLEGHSSWVNDVDFSPNGKLIGSASRDNTVKLWNVDDGTLVCTMEEPKDETSSVTFSPDYRPVTLSTLPPEQLLGNDGVRDLNFSPKGKLIASASQDNTIKLWRQDCTLMRTLQVLPGYNNAVWSVSFSPDGKQIASTGNDGTVKLWKQDGSLVRTLAGHTAWVKSVGFSPNAKLIASASYDKTVKLWKSNDGSLVGTLEGHSGVVRSISFSPDNKTLASASDDRTVILWSLALDDPLERSCNWVKDYLKNPSVSERYKHLCNDIGTQK
jgi:WD40 repeat protein/CHAT domain-containing protein